jgi:SAM-dependent methyltransferase
VKDYDVSTYGDRIADVYDEWYGDVGFLQPDAAVEFLAELAGAGPVLELAVGTGRLALPLAERGLEVHGIDASEAMVAKLREKPGGERVAVTMGDFAKVAVDGSYPLIFIAFNTFFALDSQDEQVRCFENVARRLEPGGVFCLDAFVPDPARFGGGRVSVSKIELDLVQLDVTLLDQAEQKSVSQHVVVRPDGISFYPVNVRWAYPPELDLMARLAGLELRERFGSWRRDPFTKESGHHVSLYARP